MSETTQPETTVPAWIEDMNFCHISPWDNDAVSYCGLEGDGPLTCSDYDGEAICPDCGLPTCPRCAQLAALADQLRQS